MKSNGSAIFSKQKTAEVGYIGSAIKRQERMMQRRFRNVFSLRRGHVAEVVSSMACLFSTFNLP